MEYAVEVVIIYVVGFRIIVWVSKNMISATHKDPIWVYLIPVAYLCYHINADLHLIVQNF